MIQRLRYNQTHSADMLHSYPVIRGGGGVGGSKHLVKSDIVLKVLAFELNCDFVYAWVCKMYCVCVSVCLCMCARWFSHLSPPPSSLI